MSNNPFRTTITPATIPAMIYSSDAKIGELLNTCLKMVGFTRILMVGDEAAALDAMDSFVPRVVIMYCGLNDSDSLAVAHKINKKRAPTKRRTPKILALMKPSTDDIVKATSEGFWDVLPLPATPAVIAGRLETVLTRLD